ncbi:Dabb family protein [Rhodobacterales bacterium HKCCSP123]|nr:Dabb family protein [Rhodobacterales bacterium HKCCSP123]
MLIHVVLMEPDGQAGLEQVQAAMPILAEVCASLPGASGFAHGPNRDFEGKSQRYAYGFEVSFTDREAHLAYERHPEHLRAGAMLVASCKGGHAGIFVADLEV